MVERQINHVNERVIIRYVPVYNNALEIIMHLLDWRVCVGEEAVGGKQSREHRDSHPSLGKKRSRRPWVSDLPAVKITGNRVFTRNLFLSPQLRWVWEDMYEGHRLTFQAILKQSFQHISKNQRGKNDNHKD